MEEIIPLDIPTLEDELTIQNVLLNSLEQAEEDAGIENERLGIRAEITRLEELLVEARQRPENSG